MNIEKFINHVPDPAQIRIIEGREMKYEYEDGYLSNVNSKYTKTYYIRVIHDGKLGSAYCYSEDQIKDMYEKACKNGVPFSGRDFPEVKERGKSYLEKNISYETLRELCEIDFEWPKKVLSERRIGKYYESSLSFLDNHGTEFFSDGNYVYLNTEIALEDRVISYENASLNPNYLVEDISNNINEMLEVPKTPIKVSGKQDVVLFIRETANFLDLVLNGLHGDYIEEKNTWSWDKFGKKVFSDITVVEDPNAKLIERTIIDDDGVKVKKKMLIKDGTFLTPVYDYFTAKKYDKESTGNGFFVPDDSHGIDFTNIIVDGKEKYDLENCIVAYDIMGYHTCDENSGKITLGISLGALVKRGEMKGLVRDLNIVGSIEDLIKNAAITKEKKMFFRYHTPELVLRGVKVA